MRDHRLPWEQPSSEGNCCANPPSLQEGAGRWQLTTSGKERRKGGLSPRQTAGPRRGPEWRLDRLTHGVSRAVPSGRGPRPLVPFTNRACGPKPSPGAQAKMLCGGLLPDPVSNSVEFFGFPPSLPSGPAGKEETGRRTCRASSCPTARIAGGKSSREERPSAPLTTKQQGMPSSRKETGLPAEPLPPRAGAGPPPRKRGSIAKGLRRRVSCPLARVCGVGQCLPAAPRYSGGGLRRSRG